MLTKNLTPTQPTEKDIEKINSFARRKISQDELYTFSMILCGNDIDRDCEAFTKDALISMTKLFQGKTGIIDHKASSKNQIARIYKTSVVKSDEKTLYGEDKYLLKAWAYMVKSPNTKDLILKIDAGIIKEVSVSCNIGKKVCSICNTPYDGSCNHILGKKYDGAFCYIKLENPLDAYEWSFVAIPAQLDAGVTKHYKFPSKKDNEFQKQALAGKYYENRLKASVLKLSFLVGFMKNNSTFKDILDKLSIKELESFESEFSKKLKEKDFSPSFVQFKKNKLKNENKDYFV